MESLIPPALELDRLTIHIPTSSGVVRAVEDFNLVINQGERWCLLGESGCGKTILALSILRLLPAGADLSGQIRLSGTNVLDLHPKELKNIRGRGAAMIFEQPMSCLDPLFTVGDQVMEAVMVQEKTARKEAREKTLDLLHRVRLPSPDGIFFHYPHELSGGMAQKVMIAMALAGKSKLIIADEPTTALDASVQIQIIDLMNEILDETGASLLLISHDPDAASSLADTIAVMYAGRMLEKGRAGDLLENPGHPYTKALFRALSGNEPRPIPGRVPSLTDLPPGCPFHPRCSEAVEKCRLKEPEFTGNIRCHHLPPCSA